MGAIPYRDGGGGVTFRIWAPFAARVSVAGTFNQWSSAADPLSAEGNGFWSADVPAARIGHEYKIVLNDSLWRIDPQARAVTNSVGNGVITDREFEWKINDFQAPPWHEMVVYQMHLATFPDAPVGTDTLFDAVLSDANVAYLRELGVNTLLLLPTGEFPGDSSWGYNPAHIFAVESFYGGPAELKHFIDRAHEKGFAVMLDVVYNHFGPNDLPTWQFDGWHPSWQGEDMGGIYFYNDWRARTPWGRKNRPDYARGEVRQFIRDNVLMWLEEFRADGLRFDMTVFVRNVDGSDGDAFDDPRNLGGNGWSLLQWVNDEVNRRQPWKLTMAEDLQVNAWVTKETGAGGLGFDTQWDGRFLHPVRNVLKQIDDQYRDMDAIRTAIEGRYYNGNPFERVIYTESHDEVATSNGKRRVPEDISPGAADSWYAKKRSTLGAALVFTSPGIPMIFQGQEILEWIPFGDQNRVDWDKYDRFRGIYHLYRDFIQLRRNWNNNTRGLRGTHVNVYHAGNDKVVAFHRWDQGGPGDDVVIVLNFSIQSFPSYAVGFPRPGDWMIRLNSDWNGYDASFGNTPSFGAKAYQSSLQGMPCSGNIGIGPYSCVILSQ